MKIIPSTGNPFTLVQKTASKKTASKKTASKKTASKKTASKKTASKKTASKKTTSKKTASKKTASKKTASKKTASKKPESYVNLLFEPDPYVGLYGRRKTDILPGVEINDDGSLQMKLKIIEGLNQRALNLSMLMDSARSIMAEMSLDNLLGLIMESVTKVMDADRSTLYLIDHDKNEIWSRVAQGTSEIRISLGEGIAGHVAKTGEIVNIPDAYKDGRFNSDFDMKSGYRTKSILCMPVKDPRGNIIGAIQVLNKLDGSEFSNENVELLGAFSSLAGISLANAQAYEELEKERDLLEIRVRERTADLEASRKKSDELLLNILPAQIADELKENGSAKPRRYEMVTVLFTDFKGFTQIAEKMEAEKLIDELDFCFHYFDHLAEIYNLEKIKTIGDSYMCAGGVPGANRSNPIEAILAALNIQRFMKMMADEKKENYESFWELRIGMHTGPVVAGVVGKNKFAYDIWGDTVNTASRMESAGEPGKINISVDTYNYVKEYFKCTPRGKIAAKNKGEIDMYFLEGLKEEYSRDGEGLKPNQHLLDVMDGLRNPV